MIEKQQSLAAAIAPLFVCAYNPAAAGSNPKHTIYTFSNLYYWDCNQKLFK